MRLIIILFGCLGFLSIPALIPPVSPSAGVRSAMDYFKTEAGEFAHSCTALRQTAQSIPALNASPISIARAREQLIDCRRHYKRIESFLEYFFRSSSRIYNQAPKYEAEEPDMEYQSPVGLQVIESLLYEKKSRIDKTALLEQIKAVESAATDLPALLYNMQASDAQVLESLRIELIRVMALGITGFDAPRLKSGILESYEAMVALRQQLQPYLVTGEARSDSLRFFLDKAIGCLAPHTPANHKSPDSSPAFDTFDRLAFLTGSALPLQHQLGLFIRGKRWELNTSAILNYEADNLFSPDALSIDRMPGIHTGNKTAMIRLGKILFSETSLSGNGKKSCATCHDPGKMFSDQLTVPVAFDGHHLLDRNAPSLLYSGFQYSQFWDGRAKTLEEQVRAVLKDPREMNADTVALAAATPSMNTVVEALATYVRSLHPMNSLFDRYMNGDATALNAREKNGANLFMGKAQCATCHFIPLFNGLIPPDYARTEFEVLGTTVTDQFEKARLSSDPGRYALYNFPFYKGAFKTPTVRNTAATGPYMHNGGFRSLEKVMDFYNKGGGAGLGLQVPEQTLAPDPLHLDHREIGDIILFIHTLTDKLHADP